MEKIFIKATEAYGTVEHPVAAPYLRRAFDVPFPVEKAELCICGLGFYRLFLNGAEITKGALAAYISNPDDICYYDRYDLSGLLPKGRNAIGILLGNGLMNAPGRICLGYRQSALAGCSVRGVGTERLRKGRGKAEA